MTTHNTIGGTSPAAANTIAHSGNDGVYVYSGTGNAILRNSIFDSGNLGIELDAMNKGNDNEPAPVISSVTTSGGSTTIAAPSAPAHTGSRCSRTPAAPIPRARRSAASPRSPPRPGR